MTHAKLMEYMPDRDGLVLRAGVGWKDGYVGQYQVPPDTDTPIGYAFSFSEPVPITDYNSETNNLSLVAAMVSVQARRMPESGGREELVNAVARINNLALVHDRLQLFTSSVTKVDAAPHFWSFARCFAHYCRLAWP
jgi:hypothetical protein